MNEGYESGALKHTFMRTRVHKKERRLRTGVSLFVDGNEAWAAARLLKKGVVLAMKLAFHFDEPGEENIRVVNQALSGMRIGELKLVDVDGSAATRKQYENEQIVSITHWYNVMDLELEITPADDGDFYAIEAEVIPMARALEHGDYVTAWRMENPERLVRIVQSIRFGDSLMAYIVISFTRG